MEPSQTQYEPGKVAAGACPVECTIDVIGGKWKVLIIWYLLESNALRFAELKSLLPGISQKVLTNQLRELEADGLVNRTIHAEVPPRVDYSLTALGRTTQRLFDVMCDWGESYMKARPETREE